MLGVRRLTSLVAVGLAVACAPLPDAEVGIRARPRVPTSLFDPAWTWTDEEGRQVTFERWRGFTLVVTTIYTSCVRTCPLTVDKLRAVYESFRRHGRDAQFLLITLDPSVDTPQRLREYKESRKLPPSWHLLAGKALDTRDLEDLLDVHVIDMDPHIVHEAKISIFDARGVLARSFECCDFDADAAAE